MNKYNEIIKLLRQNKPVEITYRIFHWNAEIYYRIHTKERRYGWFICQDKLIVCCHGGIKGEVQINKNNITTLQYLVNKLGYLAKKQYNNKIYIFCCYGNKHRQIINGVEFVSLAPTDTPCCSLARGYKNVFKCTRLDDFIYFYNNVIKNFRIQVSYKEIIQGEI